MEPIKASRKPIKTILPLRTKASNIGSYAKNNQKKANIFSQNLVKVFNPTNNAPDLEIKYNINNNIHGYPAITPLSPKEIKEETHFLNNKNAPRIKIISSKMLNELPREGLGILIYIFNAILRLEYWPN